MRRNDLQATVYGFDISPRTLIADVRVEGKPGHTDITLFLDMERMGISEDSDFEMALTKDIMREVSSFYEENGYVPSSTQLKELVEMHDY